MGEGANKPKAQCHPDRTGVDAAGGWSEGHASYLGRSVVVLETARDAERRTDAAAEVSNGQSSPAELRRRTTRKDETSSMRSMRLETLKIGVRLSSRRGRIAAEPRQIPVGASISHGTQRNAGIEKCFSGFNLTNRRIREPYVRWCRRRGLIAPPT